MRLINKILSAKGLKTVTNGEYENIQKYRVARGELKQTIDDYNKILSLFVKNATIKQLKDILKEKNIEEIPIEKKELQLKVSHLLQKEFK
jgi:hypothetical protein